MRLSVLLSLLPLALAGPTGKRAEPAPVLTPRAEPHHLISDKYIVKFKEGSALSILEDAFKMIDGGKPDKVFDGVFTGFAGTLSKLTLEALRHHPDVEYIEQDAIARTDGYVTQNSAPWGLGRISHRQPGSSQYVYDDSAGEGVCAYIIDSGIDASHPEFEGRATWVRKFGGGPDYDNCQHGTHVAGTIGSRTYGVAKKANLYAIKALTYSQEEQDCTGQYSDIIAAMNYVSTDSANRDCPNGIVVNMSLGGGYAQSVNDAADGLVRRGYFVAVAAGNSNKDASGFSPASTSSVCTVGGTARDDTRYSGSNYGSYVDINGPAVGVVSTVPGGGTASFTGTSMASPHIAGLAAYIASRDGVRAGPELCSKIAQEATRNAIRNPARNTVNLIAFNGNPSG